MITVASVDARVTHVSTRIPFRYGIAEMVAAPHVVVELSVSDGDRVARGWASEHLPPKWFTKDPDSLFVDEIADMVGVILHAVDASRGRSGGSAFEVWRVIDESQQSWAADEGIPGLLAGLGTALVERALIDAVCRLEGVPFGEALRSGALGWEPAVLHPELAGRPAADLLPRPGAPEIAIRHTVGLSDALTDDEVVDAPADGLPVSLDSVLARYGVTHLKIKTAGRLDDDIPRLHRILDVMGAAGIDPVLTIDGNESMRTAEHLVEWARGLLADDRLAPVVRDRLVAVEQPFHRSIALGVEAAAALEALRGEVAVIIDESDDAVTTVRAGMDLGYAGGTYKGCKGVFRGLANAALAGSRGGGAVLTAEDLSTVPPLTVAQDLVVAHAMGLTHIERNGHHYFGRLAPLGDEVEETALAAHPDLYERSDGGRVRLRIAHGSVALGTLLESPFGFSGELDVSGLEPLSVAAATRGM
ncbi:hypothetical protein [Antiquaquibacter soli]|uniref:Mandelate racemase n=1 Tax=Antiquaquibacter soli TaxID=3064523 RepID=A0ABT9BNF8_9MICO|nr:hypothetical protein [Protaetiibacter sp. WY-16]MDO7881917.1 hypothetical protein [Protaetiibacter sp. WY-16]